MILLADWRNDTHAVALIGGWGGWRADELTWVWEEEVSTMKYSSGLVGTLIDTGSPFILSGTKQVGKTWGSVGQDKYDSTPGGQSYGSVVMSL